MTAPPDPHPFEEFRQRNLRRAAMRGNSVQKRVMFRLWLYFLLALVLGVFFAWRSGYLQQGPQGPSGGPAGTQPGKTPALDPASPEFQARRAELQKQFDGALFDPADGAEFTETQGYRRLLRHLLDTHVHTPVPEKPAPFDRELAMTDPDAQRGKLVAVQGLVADLDVYAHKLEQPIFQYADVWRLILTDNEGDNAFVVDLLTRPSQFETRRDVIELEGLFWRQVGYQTKDRRTDDGRVIPGRQVKVPYILAREARVVVEGQDDRWGKLRTLVTITAFLMLGGWVIFRIAQRNHRPTDRWRVPSHLHPPGRSRPEQ